MKPIQYMLFACLLMLSPKLADAQEVGLFVGVSSYEGDVNERDFILPTELNLAFGLQYKMPMFSKFHLSANYYFAKITGDDQNFENRAGWNPNLSFTSSIQEISFQFEWRPVDKRKLTLFDSEGEGYDAKDIALDNKIFDSNGTELNFNDDVFVGVDGEERTWVYNNEGDYIVYGDGGDVIKERYVTFWSPYLFIGAGFSIMSKTPEVLDLETNSYSDFEEISAYGNFHPTIPVGGGLYFNFSKKLTLAAEASYKYYFSDYIDGISDSRDPDDNDWTFFAGIRVNYKLTKAKSFYF